MQVKSYIFQSPYSSQVQIGRPDPNAKGEDSAVNSQQAPAIPNETLQNANSFASTIITEVTPTVESRNLLDTYA